MSNVGEKLWSFGVVLRDDGLSSSGLRRIALCSRYVQVSRALTFTRPTAYRFLVTG